MLDPIAALLAFLFGLRGDFQKVFFRNELQSLVGKNHGALFVLAFIYWLTWLSLGYATGGLSTLEKRMDNPYTNWVDWPIPSGKSDKYLAVETYLKDPAIRDSFFLKDVRGYVREMRVFKHAKTQEHYYKRGRTMDQDDELLKRILDSKSGNVIAGLRDIDEDTEIDHCGLIVRAEMLLSLGYDDPADQKMLPITVDTHTVYLPIVSVVRDLPNLSDYICSPNLYNALNLSFEKTGFLTKPTGSTYEIWLTIDEEDSQKVKQTLSEILDSFQINNINRTEIKLNTHEQVYLYQVVFENSYPSDTMAVLRHRIKSTWPEPAIVQDYTQWECPVGAYGRIEEPYYAAFNFKQLDRVRPFKQMMQDQLGIELSLDQIEDKENFALVSSLTYLVSIGLFFFSIVSIILFITNKLRSHLQQNRANIGTFKAFGLSNQLLARIYTSVIMSFLLIGLILPAVFACLYEGLNLYFKISMITLFDVRILFAFGLLIAAGYWASVLTIRAILKDTPGNLIYGR